MHIVEPIKSFFTNEPSPNLILAKEDSTTHSDYQSHNGLTAKPEVLREDWLGIERAACKVIHL